MKTGRNDPCPCGSGKKYKNCHGAAAAAAPAARPATAPARGPSRPQAIALAAQLNQLSVLMNAGRYAEAERHARTQLEQFPEHGPLWKLLGAALALQGKDALRELQRAAQLLPQDAETFYYFGNALHDRGQLAAAVECQRRAVALRPQFAEAHDNLGTSLRELGRFEEALAAHRRAIALRPELAEAHNHLGMALRAAGQFEEAMASYRQALTLRPKFPAALGNLANALRDSGRLAEAVEAYRSVLAMAPNLPAGHFNLARALLQLGQREQALAEYRLAIEQHPGFLEARVELADALCEPGRAGEAIAIYRDLIAQQPQLPELHNRLGNALTLQGASTEALASYQRALELQPAYAEALANAGNALRDLGRLPEALGCCRRAVELKPGLVEAHQNLGVAQLDLLQLSEAEASFRRAIALRPDSARAHAALSMTLRKLGRTAEAETSCRHALELAPQSAEVLAFLAEFPADRGEFAQAEALFRQALAIDPDLPEAWAGIPRFRRMGAADTEWLAGAQRLLGRALPVRHEINLSYSVGKTFDDLGDYPQAFAHYQRANELNKRYGAPFDRQAFSAHIDRKIALFDAAWLARQRAEALDSDLPVFVVGMPRSGTTLLEQIIASHPAAFGAGELAYWNGTAAVYELAAFAGQDVSGQIASAAPGYLALLASLSPAAQRVVDKMPANFMHLGLIHAALPNARLIHIRRHPVDTCLSIYFQNFSSSLAYGNDLEDLAHYYREYLRLMAHWRALLPGAALLEISYEALIEEPESVSRRLVEFTGLPWDARCLEFHSTERSVTTASKWQVRQKLSKASAGRWRHYEPFIGPLRQLLEPGV